MNQQELENKLKQAQNAYYNGSEPIMSDLEYDELWDELQTNYPDSQLLQEVGMDHTDGFAKVKHSIIMGSQNKANKPAEMDEWFDRCRNKRHKVVIETEKLDGCSIALEYRNGVFTQGITRGDGEEGDDITENVRKMQAYQPMSHITILERFVVKFFCIALIWNVIFQASIRTVVTRHPAS